METTHKHVELAALTDKCLLSATVDGELCDLLPQRPNPICAPGSIVEKLSTVRSGPLALFRFLLPPCRGPRSAVPGKW